MKLSISVKSTIHKFFSCNCCLSITSIHEWHVKFSQSGILKKTAIAICDHSNHFPALDQFAFAPLDSMCSVLYVFNNITLLTLPLSLCLHVCLFVCLSVCLSVCLYVSHSFFHWIHRPEGDSSNKDRSVFTLSFNLHFFSSSSSSTVHSLTPVVAYTLSNDRGLFYLGQPEYMWDMPLLLMTYCFPVWKSSCIWSSFSRRTALWAKCENMGAKKHLEIEN